MVELYLTWQTTPKDTLLVPVSLANTLGNIMSTTRSCNDHFQKSYVWLLRGWWFYFCWQTILVCIFWFIQGTKRDGRFEGKKRIWRYWSCCCCCCLNAGVDSRRLVVRVWRMRATAYRLRVLLLPGMGLYGASDRRAQIWQAFKVWMYEGISQDTRQASMRNRAHWIPSANKF